MNRTEMVTQFHDAFGMDVGAPIYHRLLTLRLTLISEEVRELFKACAAILIDIERGAGVRKGAVVHMIKELADLAYVVEGMAVTFGINLDEAFKRIHESNMSKLGPDGKPVYRSDGKVLKGPNYKEPELDDLVL